MESFLNSHFWPARPRARAPWGFRTLKGAPSGGEVSCDRRLWLPYSGVHSEVTVGVTSQYSASPVLALSTRWPVKSLEEVCRQRVLRGEGLGPGGGRRGQGEEGEQERDVLRFFEPGWPRSVD